MVKVDENAVNDFIYQIISALAEDPREAKKLLLELSTYITRAPRAENTSTLPKISVK
jgi:hypothetical protein